MLMSVARRNIMACILVASLGEAPVVVTAMYKLLREQEKIPVDTVMVLCPTGEDVRMGYLMIEEALREICQLDCLLLPFEDANGENESYQFLQMLAGQLQVYQQRGDTVYLALGGGRKNMSALMALVVPFFSCVKRLYQVLDVDEVNSDDVGHQFKSVTELFELSDAKRKAALNPPIEKLLVVNIPYGDQQRAFNDVRSRLFTLTVDGLDDLWDENPALAEAAEFYRPTGDNQVTQRILSVEVTERVQKEFERMQVHDSPRADRFAICFQQMRDPNRLIGTLKGKGFIRNSFSFHIYKRRRTVERPFYHTEPEGIHLLPKANVEKVIISGLAIEQSDGTYKPTVQEMLQYPLEPTVSLTTLLNTKEVVLIVPLGTTPMVVTQLYTLLKNEGRTIREVVLIYPALSQKVRNSVTLIKDAFTFEQKPISIREVSVEGMRDITSSEHCVQYQQILETTIEGVRVRHQDCDIVLSLTGGRKSMAALAMFAAQRKKIRYVYHTLIKDPKLSEDIEDETTVSALRPAKVSKQERNDRLFLRAYHSQQDQFVLFKVPVVPSEG